MESYFEEPQSTPGGLPPPSVNVEEAVEQKAKRTTTPGKPGVEFIVKPPEMVTTAMNNESGSGASPFGAWIVLQRYFWCNT